jgi:hypothetical protein
MATIRDNLGRKQRAKGSLTREKATEASESREVRIRLRMPEAGDLRQGEGVQRATNGFRQHLNRWVSGAPAVEGLGSRVVLTWDGPGSGPEPFAKATREEIEPASMVALPAGKHSAASGLRGKSGATPTRRDQVARLDLGSWRDEGESDGTHIPLRRDGGASVERVTRGVFGQREGATTRPESVENAGGDFVGESDGSITEGIAAAGKHTAHGRWPRHPGIGRRRRHSLRSKLRSFRPEASGGGAEIAHPGCEGLEGNAVFGQACARNDSSGVCGKAADTTDSGDRVIAHPIRPITGGRVRLRIRTCLSTAPIRVMKKRSGPPPCLSPGAKHRNIRIRTTAIRSARFHPIIFRPRGSVSGKSTARRT